VVTVTGLAACYPAVAQAAPAVRAASGSTVKVGLIDPVSGAYPYPSVAVGASAAVHYVNKSLRGIDGHPIDVIPCDTDGTPETNVNCANTFVQDKVSFVIDGFDVSSGSELPALNSAHIPLIGSIAQNATVNESQTSFYFGPASQAFSVGPLYVAHREGIKRIAFAAPDDPPDHAYYNLDILPIGQRLGITISVVYYSITTGANWQVIAATLEAKNPQLAGLAAGSEGNCTSLLEALRTSGYKGEILLGACNSFVTQAKQYANGVLSYTGTWIPMMASAAPATAKAELKIYTTQMAAVGGSSQVNTQQGSGTFSAIVTTVEALNAAKVSYPVSGTKVSRTLRALKNFQSFLGAKVTCNGHQWPNTSACIDSIMMTKATSHGTVEPLTNPAFEPLDTSLLKAP
jgi:branched-chain amino acid transport system substrate-binding protein